MLNVYSGVRKSLMLYRHVKDTILDRDVKTPEGVRVLVVTNTVSDIYNYLIALDNYFEDNIKSRGPYKRVIDIDGWLGTVDFMAYSVRSVPQNIEKIMGLELTNAVITCKGVDSEFITRLAFRTNRRSKNDNTKRR